MSALFPPTHTPSPTTTTTTTMAVITNQRSRLKNDPGYGFGVLRASNINTNTNTLTTSYPKPSDPGTATGTGVLIGLLSAFGSAALVALIFAVIYFFRYTSRGRIILDRIGRPGEYDDEQALAREEAEALEQMDEISRQEYFRAKGRTSQKEKIPLDVYSPPLPDIRRGWGTNGTVEWLGFYDQTELTG